MLDKIPTKVDGLRVQQASNCFKKRSTCKRDLDTRVQQPYGLLNTRQTCAACEAVTRESYPSRLKNRDGDFLPLNRDTASCHTVAGTWAARLRAMLPPAVANEQHEAPHRKEKENVSPLTGVALANAKLAARVRRVVKSLIRVTTRLATAQHHSVDCGFLLHFRLALASPIRGRGLSYLSRFLLLCSLCVLSSVVHAHLQSLFSAEVFA